MGRPGASPRVTGRQTELARRVFGASLRSGKTARPSWFGERASLVGTMRQHDDEIHGEPAPHLEPTFHRPFAARRFPLAAHTRSSFEYGSRRFAIDVSSTFATSQCGASETTWGWEFDDRRSAVAAPFHPSGGIRRRYGVDRTNASPGEQGWVLPWRIWRMRT